MEKINREKTKEERHLLGVLGIQVPALIASRFRENYTPERLEQKSQWGKNSHTPESRSAAGKKGGKKSLGLLFWNNGEKNFRSRICPGEGWVRGRIQVKSNE